MTGIVCADVLDWVREYDGPKFHALLCDPPYHLTEKGGFSTGTHYGEPRSKGDKRRRKLAKTGFMGKDWDGGDIAYQPETWAALAEHLHPGAFGMAFASARGWHRLAVAIEDAGLRIHPSIFGWSYGSGFPKATRIDTQVDKAAGAEREVAGKSNRHSGRIDNSPYHRPGITERVPTLTAPVTPLAQSWEGHRYGLQALKPALEPIIVFQKPYTGKPVECITKTGAGALFIDGARIGTNDKLGGGMLKGTNPVSEGWDRPWRHDPEVAKRKAAETVEKVAHAEKLGRWPANFVLVHHPECRRVGERRVRGDKRDGSIRETTKDGSPLARSWKNSSTKGIAIQGHADPDGLETIAAWDCHESCPARRLGEQSGNRKSAYHLSHQAEDYRGQEVKATWGTYGSEAGLSYSDTGTAARFFFQAAYNLEHADPVMYCAKASRKERDAGLEEWPEQIAGFQSNQTKAELKRGNDNPIQAINLSGGRKGTLPKRRNSHPTVKPIALAQWLATLLLPPEEYAPRRILIPFAGSGSEGIGAGLAGWDEMTLIEMDADTCEIAEARLAHWLNEPRQLELHGA